MLSLCASVISNAQEMMSVNDTLSIREAVVTTLKIGSHLDEIPAVTHVVSSLDIKKHSSTTVADALKYEPGLSMGGDGVWATNINVRGMGENRLVTLVDRNRVETATDLTASLSMIDVNDIEQVEVIKGTQSSIYGSGAVGGIINVITKDGHFAGSPYFHGSLSVNYNSADKGNSDYIALFAGGRKWYVKLNGSYAHAADMMTPLGLLPCSSYSSSNIGARLGLRISDKHIIRLQYQRNWSWDVGIPGGASFSPAATATYKNIGRTLYNAQYEITELNGNFKSLKLNAFLQQIIRNVEMLPNVPQPLSGARPVRVTPYAVHATYGGNVQAQWKWGDDHSLVAGVECFRRDIGSDRKKYIDQYAQGQLKAQLIRDEKPLPDASFTSAGAFLQDELRFFNDRLITTLGARFDMNFIRNTEVHNVEYVTDVTTGTTNYSPEGKRVTFEAGRQRHVCWSGNIGVIYKICPYVDAVANASRSYRSPALEELFKFIDLSGNKVHLGNPGLKPEKSLSADLGVRIHTEKFDFRISGFVNRVGDMIVERKVNTNPEDVNDTLVLGNASRALLYGADFSLSYTVVKGLGIYASGAVTVGMETSMQGAWLPLIPPANGRIGIAYQNRKIAGADFSALFAGARPEGRIAAGETATEAYYRLDFSVHSKVFSFSRCTLQLFGGIDNITDRTYVNFLFTNRGNIRCEPGRNFYIRVNFTF